MIQPIKITSRSNERLVQIRKVRDGKISEMIFFEGLRLAEEAVRSGVMIKEAVFTAAFLNNDRGRRLAEGVAGSGTDVIELPASVFGTIAGTVSPQGVVLIGRRPQTGPEMLSPSVGPIGSTLILYFHKVNDPSNLGAVFRTAEAAGVGGIILSEGSADPFSARALRAGMGANLRVPIWDQAGLEEWVAWARHRNFRIVAADIAGTASYTQIDWKVPSILIFGSEAHGLDETVLRLADELVRIPMKNGVESLNLAVSAGIILFEAVRQSS